jgi:hypothetical protein
MVIPIPDLDAAFVMHIVRAVKLAKFPAAPGVWMLRIGVNLGHGNEAGTR